MLTIEIVARCQRAYAVELVGRTVEVIGARLELDIGNRPAGAAKLCRIVAGRAVHSLNRFGGRHVHLQQASSLVIINPLDLQIIEQT